MKQQCLGITKSGQQCKMTGNFTDGYCHRHRPSATESAPEPAVESPRTKTPPPPQQPTSNPVVEEVGTSKPLIIAGIILLFVALAALFSGRKH